jgi:hypothetical protein
MSNTLKIGRREYSIESTDTRTAPTGVLQTWTHLKGARGADVVLIEAAGFLSTVIHMGSRRAERVNPSAITR